MATFDPISALFGGALIGLASALLMLLTGRIAGISGIWARPYPQPKATKAGSLPLSPD
jgi:uncharacterized membrane protein YedE/YeeE